MIKKCNMLLVAAGLCLLTSLTAFSEDTVRCFRESFDAPVRLPGWEMQNGWALHDGTLRRGGVGAFESVTFGEADWQNYDVEFKMRRRQIREEDQHWGIVLRAGGTAPVHLLFRGERAAWISDSGETTFGIPLPKALDSGENARWSSFRVSLHGRDLALSIDDQEIGRIRLTQDGFGKCEIYAYGVDLEIDDLQVYVFPASAPAEATAAPAAAAETPPAASPNLLINSGFEIVTMDNLPDYWGCPHWGIGDADAILNFDTWMENFRTVNEGAYEGQRCMRIVNESDGPVSSAYLLRSCNARTKPKTTYTLSAWLRSDRDQLPVRLGREIVHVTRDWKRYSVRFVNPGDSLYDDMVNIAMQSAGVLWIDAVQLEEGENATPYCPASAERRLLVHDGNTEKKLYDVPRHRLAFQDQEISIDGRLDEPVWQNLPALPMGNLDGQGTPALKTEAYIWSNAKGLYIGVKCRGKSGNCTVRERDGHFWNDPCVEVFLDSKFSRSFYHHFAVTKDNVQYDSFCLMPSWNGAWESGTCQSADGQSWSTEIFIPFGILGIGLENQEIWGFNVGRSENNTSVCWAPTYGSFHNPLRFGQLAVNLDLQKEFLFRIANPQAWRKDAQAVQVAFDVINDTAKTAELTVNATIAGQTQEKPLTLESGRKSRLEFSFDTGDDTFPVELSVRENGVLRTVANESLTVPQIMKAQLQYKVTDMPEVQLAVWTMLPRNQAKKATILANMNGKRISAPVDHELTILPLPTEGIGDKECEVTVSLVDDQNQVLDKQVLHFSKIEPGANSVFCDRFSRMVTVNGKPFFPLGFSWEGEINPQVLEHLAKIGCNSICINMWAYDDDTLQKIFDSAAEHGIYIKAVLNGRDEAQCKALMQRFKNHPALLVWNAFDEVFTIPWGQENSATVTATVEDLKKQDPHHPVIINENAWGLQYIQKKKWKFPGDIVSVDHYAWTETPNYAFYADLVDQMNDQDKEELRPSWMYILGAGYAFHVKRDHTPQEHLFMAYSCAIHGASAIYYFADYPKSHSALEAIQKIFRDLTELTPILANRLEKAPAVRCTSSEIDYTTRVYQRYLYIIAVNKSPDTAVTAQFIPDGCEKDKTITVMFEDRTIKPESGLFVDSFEGWQPHVYQIPLLPDTEVKQP